MKRKSHLVFTLLALVVSGGAYAADVYWLPFSSTLIIEGEIAKGDHAKLIYAVQHYFIPPALPSEIRITSPGGDVMEALKMADFVKKSLAKVTAFKQCDSACFFIVSAAARREIIAHIGIHRPRYDKAYFANLGLTAAQQRYEEMNRVVVDFLKKNMVPESIINKMMNTPSSEISYIGPNEFASLIGEGSPAYLEWLEAKCGSLDQDEENDFFIIDAADSYDRYVKIEELSPPGTEKSDLSTFRKYKELSERLPPGYRKYLREKGNGIRLCKSRATAEEQKRVISSLIPSTPTH